MKTQSFQRRQGGAEARAEKLPALRAGQLVMLRNGQQGKVQFVSAAMKVARVSMSDGKTTRTVRLTEITPAQSERDDSGSLPAGRAGMAGKRAIRGDGGDTRGRALHGHDFDEDVPVNSDIDPEEGFDEQEEFEARNEDLAGLRDLPGMRDRGRRELPGSDPGEDCDPESCGDGGVEYVPPYDEPDELEEYADGHDRDDDHEGHHADDDDDPGDEDAGDSDQGGAPDEYRKPEIRRTVERARPVAGQRPMVSDRVTARAERSIEGPPKPVRRKDVEKLGKKDPESGRPIVQPSDSIRQNERLAAQAAPELETRLSRLAARVEGAKFVRLRPQKNPVRVREKVHDEDKPAETISDYLASQISADSVEAKGRVIAELRKHFKVVDVEDSFLKGREEKAGYPSANVQVVLSNGSTAEVQIVPREVQHATEQSHHFYKMGRNARDAGKTALSQHYFAQAKAINERALARFRLRNANQKQKPYHG